MLKQIWFIMDLDDPLAPLHFRYVPRFDVLDKSESIKKGLMNKN